METRKDLKISTWGLSLSPIPPREEDEGAEDVDVPGSGAELGGSSAGGAGVDVLAVRREDTFAVDGAYDVYE